MRFEKAAPHPAPPKGPALTRLLLPSLANRSALSRPQPLPVEDADEALSIGELRSRAVHGVKLLALVQALKIAGSIILARVLVPEMFGLFAVAGFIVGFVALLSELGLGAALIRKEEEPTSGDLKTVFTIQLFSSLVLCLLVFLAAPLLLAIYPESVAEVTWLLRALVFTLLISSFRTIPAIQLERKLLFGRISLIEAGETIAYQVVAVALALCGLGAWSFVVAMLLRGVVGAALACALSPWRPCLGVDRASAKGLLGFGLPYQGTHLLSLINGAIAPVLLGVIAAQPAVAIGYITFAATHALRPQLLLEIVGRVAFPAYARIQDDKDLLKKAIEKSVDVLSKIIFPFVAIFIGLAPQVVGIIFTDKWLPAVPVMYLYLAAMFFIVPMIVQMRSLTALGRADVLFRYSVLTTALHWAIAVPLCTFLERRYGKGFMGVGIVFLVCNVIGVTWTLLYLRSIVRVRIVWSLRTAFPASVAAGLLCYALSGRADTLLRLGIVAAAALGMYALILLIAEGKRAIDLASDLLKRP